MSAQDRFRRIDELFRAALRLDPEARRGFIDGQCGDDAELRAELDALLAADLAPTSGLDRPPFATPIRPSQIGLGAASSVDEPLPDTIGPYRIMRKIGEGGMGVVYEARQEEPVRRTVALKIIKLGMDTRQVIARFESERQALAMMSHPNIARVLDAGATELGRPYFVMELVKGVPITTYCDDRNLSTRDRLALFTRVCEATQHAHQKGIIHRDIKPSNVLVSDVEGGPTPKVIDFGVAKATDQQLTEKTLLTQVGQLVGTPQYMSPEQAGLSELDIDTRTDIYSLGVLLYELLTGVTPFDARTLRWAGIGEIQRVIREDEPPKPSTRVSGLKEGTEAPRHRGTEEEQSSSIEAIARVRRTDPGRCRGRCVVISTGSSCGRWRRIGRAATRPPAPSRATSPDI